MWERSLITGEMDETLRMSDGSAIGRRAAHRVFVAAELDGVPPLNPYTRQPFAPTDEATIFAARATRARPAVYSYAEWRETSEGVALTNEMRSTRTDGVRWRAEADRDDVWADDVEMQLRGVVGLGEDSTFIEWDGPDEFEIVWDAMVAQGPRALANAPDHVRGDPGFVLSMMERMGSSVLEYAAEPLLSDVTFMFRAADTLRWINRG